MPDRGLLIPFKLVNFNQIDSEDCEWFMKIISELITICELIGDTKTWRVLHATMVYFEIITSKLNRFKKILVSVIGNKLCTKHAMAVVEIFN